jgi:alpha-ketoglutarate-dependent 2,4-dichlorophenoxyacetate dioxygenase
VEKTIMAWTRRKLTEHFGVELSGQALGPALPMAERRAVYDAVTQHGVVVLPGQELTDEDIDDFASSLGAPIKIPPGANEEPVAVRPFGNLDKDGNFIPRDSAYGLNQLANMMWHIDSTYQKPRATLSMLFGVVIPPEGGNTDFCDMRRAWDMLSPEEQAELDGLTAHHSIAHSRALAGFTDWPEGYDDLLQKIPRPLVGVHPDTGRKALLTASHIETLTGKSTEETTRFVAELIRRATVPENCYSHRWAKGDFLLWDNRCVMHRATPFQEDRDVREMRTVRLMDTAEI